MTLDWTTSYVFNTPWAVRSLELLFVVSAGIQTLEYWRMRSGMQGDGLWVWSIQRQDIPTPWMRHFLDALFVPNSFSALLILRLIALISMTAHGSNLLNIGFLFISNLAILIRWRGAFNGGSDFMTLVVLTGLLMAQIVGHFAGPELGWRAGFWYITLQSITSYFLSGSVKLRQREWRNGSAMTIFLNAAIHGPLSANHWLRKPWLAALGSWAFIVWECLAPSGFARHAIGFGLLPDRCIFSLPGVLVLWLEPILLGMVGHLSGHCLVCWANMSLSSTQSLDGKHLFGHAACEKFRRQRLVR